MARQKDGLPKQKKTSIQRRSSSIPAEFFDDNDAKGALEMAKLALKTVEYKAAQ